MTSIASPRRGNLTSEFDRRIRSGKRLALTLAKRSYLAIRFSPGSPKSIGLIMGVQRSGTGALVQAFESDWNCRTFGEDGGLALGENFGRGMRWRWKPYHEVARLLQRERAPLLVGKPLLESQNAAAILACIPGAKVIWAFRDYRDVALSGRKHFGSESIKYNLESILDRRDHWYSENVDEQTQNLVSELYSNDRPIDDLRALGWYVRNSLVFRYENFPIRFSNYDDLATNPGRAMRRLYDFLERPYPGDYIVSHIHPQSVKRGRDIGISQDIRELCDGVMDRLVERSADS